MQTITELVIEKGKRAVFTRQEAAFWSGTNGAALDGLLKRAIQKREIVRYRRGLYGLAPRYERYRIHPFVLAQYLYGPSYISLEAALSYHGWIPEAVYTITCATLSRSHSFETSLGFFSFTRIPQNIFFAGVRQQTASDGSAFFLASPLKALVDYVYVHRPAWNSLEGAWESLRIEESELKTVDVAMVNELNGVYREKVVIRFLEKVRLEVMP
jgi:predicted transcriptional regulator of viral defense system